MQYRKLSLTGDYTFGGGNNNFYTDTKAVAQSIRTKLLVFYSEWWEDITIGMPMFETIIGQVNSQNIASALKEMVKKRLKAIPEITSTKNIEVQIDGRTIHLTITAMVGEEEIEVEVTN